MEQTVQEPDYPYKQSLGLDLVCLAEEMAVGMPGEAAWEVDRQST